MAGMGPTPKHPSTRQRRHTSRAVLRALEPDEINIPELPTIREWLPQTIAWWEDIWSSPMAPEFHQSDMHGLFRLAVLIDAFWSDPEAKAHSEIRLAQKDYGLTPLDRRRLEWQIEATEEKQAQGTKRRLADSPDPVLDDDDEDPRRGLSAVR